MVQTAPERASPETRHAILTQVQSNGPVSVMALVGRTEEDARRAVRELWQEDRLFLRGSSQFAVRDLPRSPTRRRAVAYRRDIG